MRTIGRILLIAAVWICLVGAFIGAWRAFELFAIGYLGLHVFAVERALMTVLPPVEP